MVICKENFFDIVKGTCLTCERLMSSTKQRRRLLPFGTWVRPCFHSRRSSSRSNSKRAFVNLWHLKDNMISSESQINSALQKRITKISYLSIHIKINVRINAGFLKTSLLYTLCGKGNFLTVLLNRIVLCRKTWCP